MDTRLSEGMSTHYYKKDPLPRLTINNPKLIEKWINPYDHHKHHPISHNSDWLNTGRAHISFPETYPCIEKRFKKFLTQHIVEQEFSPETLQQMQDKSKVVLLVSHGYALETIGDYFGGDNHF